MLTHLYTIYDSKAAAYKLPFYQINDDVALRTAIDLLLDKDSQISKHPHDFVMFKLGSYDDITARFDLLPSPESFVRFHELKSLQEQTL